MDGLRRGAYGRDCGFAGLSQSYPRRNAEDLSARRQARRLEAEYLLVGAFALTHMDTFAQRRTLTTVPMGRDTGEKMKRSAGGAREVGFGTGSGLVRRS
jgi:hypothetical protein